MRLPSKTFWTRTLCLVLVLWIGFNGLVAYKMSRPPEEFGRFMAKLPVPFYFVIPFETLWSHFRAGKLQVGDVAPDFDLATLDRTGRVRLSTLRQEKPVVLVFGSYT
jgi:hypothetical protein